MFGAWDDKYEVGREVPMLRQVFEAQVQQVVEKGYKRCRICLTKDFKDHGSALPGYFQLLKYYAFFCICVFLVNSIYPIYATYYACEGFEEGQSECLKVGYFYYLDYKTLISILNKHHKVDMVNVFWPLLRCCRCCRRRCSIYCWLPTASVFSSSHS